MNYSDKQEKLFRRISKCLEKNDAGKGLKFISEDKFVIIALKRTLQKAHEKYNSKKKLEYQLSLLKYCK